MLFFAKAKKFFGILLLILFVALILFLSVRGLPGNPTPAQLNSPNWISNGPFELSNERGRYVLLYSLIENHSFNFTPELARFAAPDVGYYSKKYVSLFAPSVSFVAIPGYIIGKFFGVAQFGTFLWMSVFALLNVLLIRAIAIKLGADPRASTIAGIVFLFATPAYAYAVTMYEHHLSTFLILLSLYLLVRYNSILSLLGIWFLYAFAFTVDYPNLFMMFPIALAAFFKSFTTMNVENQFTVRISLLRILTVFAVIVPLIYFMWFNQMSYNNPLKISGTTSRVLGVQPNGKPVGYNSKTKQPLVTKLQQSALPPAGSIFTFFKPRNMINGLYILLISPDRGILVFTPVIMFGVLGIYLANKRKQKYISVFVGVVAIDLILYSMWGDPYGGWAFGSRYMIPGYAILAVYIAVLLSYWKRKTIFLIAFFVVLSYSVIINTVGALTSNSNPPKIEAEALSAASHQPVDYTYMRNFNLLNTDVTRAYVYETYASDYLSGWQYYRYIVIFILVVMLFLFSTFFVVTRKKITKGEIYES